MNNIHSADRPTGQSLLRSLLAGFLALCAATTGWATARTDYNPGHSDFPDLEQEDLVDLTIAAGEGATGAYDSAPGEHGDYGAANSFNDVLTDRSLFKADKSGLYWVTWRFNTPTVVNAYRVMPDSSGYATRRPQTFKLQGSNDNATWVDLSDRSEVDSSSWTAKKFNEYFTSPTNTTAYTYYRFAVSAICGGSTYVDISEIELFNIELGSLIRIDGETAVVLDDSREIAFSYNLAHKSSERTTVRLYYGASDAGTTAEDWASSVGLEDDPALGVHTTVVTATKDGETLYGRFCLACASQTCWSEAICVTSGVGRTLHTVAVSVLNGGSQTTRGDVSHLTDGSGILTNLLTGKVCHDIGDTAVVQASMYNSSGKPSDSGPNALLFTLPDGACFDRVRIFNGSWYRGSTSSDPFTRGAKTFALWYGDTTPSKWQDVSVDNGWTQLDVGTTQLELPDPSLNDGTTFDFSVIAAKYVVMLTTANWGGSYLCLSEVQFFDSPRAAGAPVLNAVTATEDAATNLVLGATLSGGAATMKAAVSADGGATFFGVKTSPSTVAVGETATLVYEKRELDSWTQYRTYSFYLIAENAAGAVTNTALTKYIGDYSKSDKNVWIATGSTWGTDGYASESYNWSKGVPAGDLAATPIWLNGNWSDQSVRWVTGGKSGLVADIPVIHTEDFAVNFRVDSVDEASMDQGSVPFEVGAFHVGLNKATPMTLKSGTYRIGGATVVGFGSGSDGSSLRIDAGVALTTKSLEFKYPDSTLFVTEGADVTVSGSTSLSAKDTCITVGLSAVALADEAPFQTADLYLKTNAAPLTVSVPRRVRPGVHKVLTVTGGVKRGETAISLADLLPEIRRTGTGSASVTFAYDADAKTITATAQPKGLTVIVR